jgi:selenoprotein W-related protein
MATRVGERSSPGVRLEGMSAANSPRIVITYCTQCRWLLRATWLASELLTTFTTEIAEVALRPGVGGVFRVSVNDDLVWDREVDGGFPDLGRLKRDLRDRVAPGRDLGHTDRAAT